MWTFPSPSWPSEGGGEVSWGRRDGEKRRTEIIIFVNDVFERSVGADGYDGLGGFEGVEPGVFAPVDSPELFEIEDVE